MRFGSLFAGIGGLDLGLERAGMECAWQVEIDDFCQKVLTKHWPNVPKYGDIRDVGKENLETVDLIVGGFPCQPFSVAGKRKGTEDDRHLWPEMLRVISELKPTWVIGENVPGIIKIFLDQAILDLEAEGYSCEAFVLPACGFDAPHKRDRLFVVAHTRSGRFGKQGDGSKQQGRTEIISASEDRKASQRKIGSGRGEYGVVQNSLRVRCNSSEREEKSETRGQREFSSGDLQRVCRKRERTMADTECEGTPKSGGAWTRRAESRNGSIQREGENSHDWLPEPQLGRVAHGIPNRVDRLRGLGNAVVPQVAEFIGRIILEANQ